MKMQMDLECFMISQYDGYDYYLQEDSTGKSSAFHVVAGENVE